MLHKGESQDPLARSLQRQSPEKYCAHSRKSGNGIDFGAVDGVSARTVDSDTEGASVPGGLGGAG